MLKIVFLTLGRFMAVTHTVESEGEIFLSNVRKFQNNTMYSRCLQSLMGFY